MTTSPDLSPIVDLTLADVDPGDLLDIALVAAGTAMPGLVIREGFTEAAILEAQAAMDAELAFRVNRLPASLMEGLTNLNGVVRDPGAPATTTVLFTAADTAGHIIPAGTSVALPVGNDDSDAVIFTTDTQGQIFPGNTQTVVAATANVVGTTGNGYAVLTPLALLDGLSFIDSAQTGSVITGGRAPETDEAFYTRGAQSQAALSSALVVPAQFLATALLQPYVYRCLVLDNTSWSSTTGIGTVGATPGAVTVVCAGPDGLPLSAPNTALLQALLQSKAASFLTVAVGVPNYSTPLGVAGTVHLLPGYLIADVQTAIEAAVLAYLSPLSWPWSSTVRYNELVALVSNVPGVDYVISISPSSDLTLPGAAPLPIIGSSGPWVAG